MGTDYYKLASAVKDICDSLNQANLLDTVNVNENVHSRILRMILAYKKDGNYPFYVSFLKLPKISALLPKDFAIGTPNFFNELDRIDLLIEDEWKTYAIIIENKIYDAIDQERQIERYLNSCLGKGIKKDNLYALYLTADGTKSVSRDSLTEKAKEILSVSPNSKGRFTDISFKDDLLPWLKNAILLCTDSHDEQIKSALTQYEGYLTGMFGQRKSDEIKAIATSTVLQENGIHSVTSYSKHIEAVNKLSVELTRGRDQRCEDLAKMYISRPLKDYCDKRNIELHYENYSYNSLAIMLSLPGLNKAAFRFNTEGDGRNIYGICNFNVNDREILSEPVLERFHNQGFRDSLWWPIYRYPAKDKSEFLRTAFDVFWEVTVPGGTFVEYLIKSYEEIESTLCEQG